jgi:hypothetical protein
MSAGSRRLIALGRRMEGDRKRVPAVDGDHRQGEIDDLLFAEMRTNFLLERIVDRSVRDARARLGPGQRRALAVVEEGYLSPRGQPVKSPLAFAGGARLFGVHVTGRHVR